MPSFDQCHDQVTRALQKDGWQIESEQVKLSFGNRRVFVDLRASRSSNGSRRQIMLVEVKCFPESSALTEELYTAIGQYIVYRAMLMELEYELPLYLCIPEVISSTLDTIGRRAIRDSRIKLVVVNLEDERIVQWNE